MSDCIHVTFMKDGCFFIFFKYIDPCRQYAMGVPAFPDKFYCLFHAKAGTAHWTAPRLAGFRILEQQRDPEE